MRVCIRAGDTGDDFGKANCVRNYVGLTHAAPSIMDRVSVPAIFEGENNEKETRVALFLSSILPVVVRKKRNTQAEKIRAISTDGCGNHPGTVKGEQGRRSIIAKGIRESETLYFGRAQ